MSSEAIKAALKVYFIMGSPNCQKNPVDVLSEAISGGITLFQFREKGPKALVGEQKYALAEELQFICKKAGIPFIVNDDIDLALSLKADGVHIGQEDEPVEMVKERIKDQVLGVSVHNLFEAKKAIKGGADYFGVGPIFPTMSKDDAKEVQGVSVIQELRSNGLTIPIVGIGGITAENSATVIKAGADGVSVISAISSAEDIKRAAEQLKTAVFSA